MPTKEQHNDWRTASRICRNYPPLKCFDAACELMDHFREIATVIHVCILGKASSDNIMLASEPTPISENGEHWAVMLHGKVFDNLHPDGLSLKEWMTRFEYSKKNYGDSPFTEHEIEQWTYQKFLDTSGK